MGLTFDQVVKEISKHRQANPRFSLPTDQASIEAELDQFTVARMLKVRGGEQFLQADELGGAIPKASSRPRLERHQGASAVGGVNRKMAGIKTIMYWLGAGGKPVAHRIAVERAVVCVKCPLNVDLNLSDRLTAIAAEGVRKTVEAKNEMSLSTSYDDQLKVCGACDCKLDLKIWTPIKHIKKESTEESISRLDVNCWVLKES